MQRQLGMSLSEVLISLFLASIITSTLIQFYVICKKQYQETEKILESQFDVQWVVDLLSESVRRAGFTPCLSLNHMQVVDLRSHPRAIEALQIQNQPNPFIQVHRMDEHFGKIIKIESPTQIRVEHSGIFHEKHPVLIADCVHAEVHELLEFLPTLNRFLLENS
jgi:type II secretory pathway component PulJ